MKSNQCVLHETGATSTLDKVHDWVTRMSANLIQILGEGEYLGYFTCYRARGEVRLLFYVCRMPLRGADIEQEHRVGINFRLGREHNFNVTEKDPRWKVLDKSARQLIQVDVPDAAEALHMVNELYSDLDVLIIPSPSPMEMNERKDRQSLSDAGEAN